MNYKEENIKLANDFLSRFYYDSFKKPDADKYLELFLLGQCKANCEYCYLKKNQKNLYPTELNTYDTILKNLEKVINWYVENQFQCSLEIFSAEWITTPIMEKVFNLLYDKFSVTNYRPKSINMADNMLFIRYPEIVKKVEYYIDKFAEIEIPIVISASIDGKYCDFGRTEEDDEFYDSVFKFILNHKFGFHPMVSASNAKYWIDNYLWFESKLGPKILDIMTLEVRNVDWTEETIQDLIVFCDFLTDHLYECFDKNIDNLFDYVFAVGDRKNLNYCVAGLRTVDETAITCRKQKNLCIRLGDLSVAPCHRLFYPQLLAGHFETNDNTLMQFIPDNFAEYIVSRKMRKDNLPYCEECEWRILCPGHCHGASYEYSTNEYVPPQEICNVYKAKYSFLLYKYNLLGLFVPENMQKLDYNIANKILLLASNVAINLSKE